MTPGALRGAGFIVVQAAVRVASNSTTGFPCDVLFDMGAPLNFEEVHLDLRANTTDPIEDASASMMSVVFAFGAGSTSTTVLRASITNGCGATVQGFAGMSATYWPFDFTGDGGGPEAAR